jgi:hypothetical protein
VHFNIAGDEASSELRDGKHSRKRVQAESSFYSSSEVACQRL